MLNYANISENIKQQRYLRKLTQEELAALSGVSLPTIKKVESGKTGIRSSTIEAIAAALAVDMDTLLLPARRLRTIHFRSCRNMRSKEGVVAEIIDKLDRYNAIEQATGQLLEPCYKQAFNFTSPEHAAVTCRQLAGMDDINPVADIALALTALGVKTFPIYINTDKFFSLSVGEIDGGPAIIVNASPMVSYEQGAFSAIHELGHLILHKNQEKSLTDAIIWAEEDEADSFASHFLLPERGLRLFWEASAGLRWVSRVVKLKHIFGLSYKGVLMRLGDFKSLNERFINEYEGIKDGHDPLPLNKSLYIEARLCWLESLAAGKKDLL